VEPNVCFEGVGGLTDGGDLGLGLYAMRNIYRREEFGTHYPFDQVNRYAPRMRRIQQVEEVLIVFLLLLPAVKIVTL
jgi:hypothetical protein